MAGLLTGIGDVAKTFESFIKDAISDIEDLILKKVEEAKADIGGEVNGSNIVADAVAFIADAKALVSDLEALLRALVTQFTNMVHSAESVFALAKNDITTGATVVYRAVTDIAEAATKIATTLPGVITTAAAELEDAMTQVVNTLEESARTIVRDIENSPITQEIARAVSEAVDNANRFEAEITARVNGAIEGLAADVGRAITDINQYAADAVARVDAAVAAAQARVDRMIRHVTGAVTRLQTDMEGLQRRSNTIVERLNSAAPSFFDIAIANLVFAATAIIIVLLIKHYLVPRPFRGQ
jgi:hypothetical protein